MRLPGRLSVRLKASGRSVPQRVAFTTTRRGPSLHVITRLDHRRHTCGRVRAASSDEAGDDDIDEEELKALEGEIVDEDVALELDELIAQSGEDVDLDAVFGKIGLQLETKAPRSDAVEEEKLFSYPEPPQRRMKFGDLLTECGYDEDVLGQYASVLDVEVTGIQHDSRSVVEGEVFVCTIGTMHNGHHFIPQAIHHGAALIIAQALLPGGDEAYNDEDFDIEAEENSEIANSEFYSAVEADRIVMEGAKEAIIEMEAKVNAFADAFQLSDEEHDTVLLEQGMRIAEAAAHVGAPSDDEYDEDDDTGLTPHPLNPIVPMECPVPVIFALDPMEFAGVLANTFYGRPSERMITVGITGTNGKTTTAWLMRSVFEELNHLTGMMGTVEYALAADRLDSNGDLWTPDQEDSTLQRDSSTPFWAAPYEGKYEVPATTPDAIYVQRIMAGMVDRGATACVMECSSIGLEQGRVANTNFDIAVFTNLTRDHLDYHETEEAYLEAKAELFLGLNNPELQRAIINIDDPHASTFIDIAKTRVPIVTYSMSDSDADVCCMSAKFRIWETEMILRTKMGRLQIITPLIGRANIYNIMAAVASCISIGLPLESIVSGIENAEAVPGRYELIDEGQDFSVLVDYAHTPDALSALLDTCRECDKSRRIILVFGCGGERDSGKRKLMGEIAHYKADIVILTNDNPRNEPPEAIIADIVSGFPDKIINKYPMSEYNYLQDVGRVHPVFEKELLERCGSVKRYVMEDRFCAIRAAIGTAMPNDIVVIAGKGHEDYIEYADADGDPLKGWFDDRVEARNALSKLQYLKEIPYLNRKNLPWTQDREPKAL